MFDLTEERRQTVLTTMREIHRHCLPLLIGFGGSIAYGLDTPESDIDIRGVFLNPPEEWIGLQEERERLQLNGSDTVLYGLRKAMRLLLNGNPNVIELLGLRREHILYCSDEGRMILDNARIFLSRKSAYAFGAFAVKLRRQLQREVFEGKTEAKKLCKDMSHLIRIYAMGIDLLDNGRVVTYREDERELLMAIRAGKYLGRNKTPTEAYERLMETYMGGFRRASERSSLPAEPDREKANQLTMEIVRKHL